MEQSGNIPLNLIGNFSEYIGNISRECSTNIPQTYTCQAESFKASDRSHMPPHA